MIDLDTRLRLSHEEIVAEVLDGEAVVIDLSSGVYHTTNATGGALWSMLQDGHRLADVAAAIADRYEVSPAQAREDVLSFARELAAAGLLAPVEGGEQAPPPRAPAAEGKQPFEAPRLRTFHDMQELMALDPPTPTLREIAWKS